MTVKLGSVPGVHALAGLIGFELFLSFLILLYFHSSYFSLIVGLVWGAITLLAAVKEHLTVLKVVRIITILQIIGSILILLFVPLVFGLYIGSGAYAEYVNDKSIEGKKTLFPFVAADEDKSHHMRTGIIVGVAFFIVFLLITIMKCFIYKLIKAFIRENPENVAARSKA